jgi:hypothetical protein
VKEARVAVCVEGFMDGEKEGWRGVEDEKDA